MQILNASQIREWDRYTIEHEPVSSIDLMERAAGRCVAWLKDRPWQAKHFQVFCGKGNNGGDGLAISRQLLEAGYSVSCFILSTNKPGSADFETNLQRLQNKQGITVRFLSSSEPFPSIHPDDVIIDALFGSGLHKPLEGLAADLVTHISQSAATIVSIDLPSGLFIEKSSSGNVVVNATYTLTFQCYKIGLLVQENAPFVGDVVLLDIGLHPDFLATLPPVPQLLCEEMIRHLFQPRNRFSHKGSFGQALLVGGSWGKMGALVLATKACLRAGAGLTTVLVPRCGYIILQTTAPEAMTLTGDGEEYLSSLPDDIDRFSAIGVGPGMGTQAETQTLLSFLVRRYQKPMVLDADALNCLAMSHELLALLSPYSVLTPHPKEFDRLFGNHESDFDRLATAKEKATEYQLIILLKSHHSFIATPTASFFNATGNAGMAKGGSGDVLTGMITAFLAQGYTPSAAVQLGVYLHGWAGDVAAAKYSKEAMLPTDLIDCLADVFLQLS